MGQLQERYKNYREPQKYMAAGVYPYFREITSKQMTEVTDIDGHKILMFGSNAYQGLTNDQRVIDAAKADIVVSIHQNSYQSPEVKGAQVFYYKHSAEGKKLAQILQKSLKENLDTENKRQEKEDSTYYMLLHTGAPTVIAECGFLSNPQEAALLNTAEYRQKVAEALCKGILEYFTSTGK